METRAHHVLIGAFTLVVLGLGALSMLWLGNMRLSTPWDYYDIVFDEAVTGLTVGGAVQYSGIQVGEVHKLSLDRQDPRRVVARIRVDGGTPIKTDTTAQLTVTGLTFVAVIQLAGGTPEAPLLRDASNDTPPRIVATRSAMQNLLSSGEDIVTLVQETLRRIATLLDERNVNNVGNVIAHVETITAELAKHDTEIGTAISDLAQASQSLRRVLARSETVMGKVDRLADNSSAMLDGEARQLLVSTTRVADSLGKLIDVTGPTLTDVSNRDLSQIGPALAEFRAAARAMRDLAKAIEDDPQSVLRGKRERLREREAK